MDDNFDLNSFNASTIADQNRGGSAEENNTPKLPTLDEIKARLCSTNSDADVARARLYILMRNYEKALRCSNSNGGELPRWALECLGLDKDLSFGLQILVMIKGWKRAPTWKQIQADTTVLDDWESAQETAKRRTLEQWNALKSVKTRRDLADPAPYQINDFLKEVPEWDKDVESRFAYIQSDEMRKAMIQSELQRQQERRQDREENQQMLQALLRTITQPKLQEPGPESESGSVRNGQQNHEVVDCGVDGRRAEAAATSEAGSAPEFPLGLAPEFNATHQNALSRNVAGNQSLRGGSGQPEVPGLTASMGEQERERRTRKQHNVIPLSGRRRFHSSSSQDSDQEDQACENRLARRLDYPEDHHQEFMKVERGAIKIPGGVGKHDVMPPRYDGKDPRRWIGFKTTFELYLSGRRATSVQAQKRLLTSCLDGTLQQEFIQKWRCMDKDWFDLANYWTQLDRRFSQDEEADHNKSPERWIADNPWDGYEWTLSPFLTDVAMRTRNLLGSSASEEVVSLVTARAVYEHGLPSELLRELNAKIRALPSLDVMQRNVNELHRQITYTFREFRKAHSEVPWPQGKKTAQKSSQSYSGGRDNFRNWRERSRSTSRARPLNNYNPQPYRDQTKSPERRRSYGEEWRERNNQPSPFAGAQQGPRGLPPSRESNYRTGTDLKFVISTLDLLRTPLFRSSHPS